MDEWSKKVGEKLKGYSYDQPVSEDKVQAFFDRKDTIENRPVRNRSKSLMMIAASFVFLLMAGIGIYFTNNVSVSTSPGEVATLALPDGSQVDLAYDSKISFNRLTWIWTRNVSLEGEAYFEVQKGSKFSVESDQGTTSVLGTKFNVYASADQYAVECFEGRVMVQVGSSAEELTIGEGIDYRKRRAPKRYTTKRKKPGWKDGELYFNGQDIQVVLGELERVFGIEIVGKDKVPSQEYNGYFPAEGLDTALKLVLDPVGASYSRSGQVVTIK